MRKNKKYLALGIVCAAIVVIIIITIVSSWGGSENSAKTNTATRAATTTKEKPGPHVSVIGQSVEKRDIKVFSFGHGSAKLLFVGDIHGGYEWNSALLAFHLIDWLKENPDAVPKNLTVEVVPVLNPDGLAEVLSVPVGPFKVSDVSATSQELAHARLNADDVDLNRNFPCQWQKEARWRGNAVSAGTSALSEPEAKAIHDYILKSKPVAAVFFHSQAGNVYGSSCGSVGPLLQTLDIMHAYASAAKLGAVAKFDAYPVHGAVEDWMASIGIPAITVELKTHGKANWPNNLAGIQAVVNYYKK